MSVTLELDSTRFHCILQEEMPLCVPLFPLFVLIVPRRNRQPVTHNMDHLPCDEKQSIEIESVSVCILCWHLLWLARSDGQR
jgi:hypothetical protein